MISACFQRRELVGNGAADGVVHEHDEGHRLAGREIDADVVRAHEARYDEDVGILQEQFGGQDDQKGG